MMSKFLIEFSAGCLAAAAKPLLLIKVNQVFVRAFNNFPLLFPEMNQTKVAVGVVPHCGHGTSGWSTTYFQSMPRMDW